MPVVIRIFARIYNSIDVLEIILSVVIIAVNYFIQFFFYITQRFILLV